MRRTTLLTILLPALLLAGAASAQNIKLEPGQIDLGTMRQRESRSVTVKVSNTGAGLLVIEGVHADCGCTVPELTRASSRARRPTWSSTSTASSSTARSTS